jgi:hypothetical protein
MPDPTYVTAYVGTKKAAKKKPGRSLKAIMRATTAKIRAKRETKKGGAPADDYPDGGSVA